MESIDIQQIESYLRGKMAPEEQRAFETRLHADPLMLHRTEELRQLSEGIRHVAKSDIRQRVEAKREQIKQEEKTHPGRTSSAKSMWFLFAGLLLGLGLGWLIFEGAKTPQHENLNLGMQGPQPVAIPQYEPIATIWIPSPIAGKRISLSIMYNPGLDRSGAQKRKYALDRGGAGLCIYARREDNFWKKDLALLQAGQKFYLKIDGDKFLLQDDGEEHPFPEKPSTD